MNSIDPQYYALSTPIFLAMQALLCGVVWRIYPAHRALGWLALSYCVATVAVSIQTVLPLQATHIFTPLMTAMYVLAEATLAQALAVRMGQRIQLAIVLPVGALTVAGMWHYGATEPNLPLRMIIISVGLAIILSHILPSVWRAHLRHRADRITVAMYTLGALCMWLRPLFTLLGDPAPATVMAETTQWWLTMMLVQVVTALFTTSFVACTLMDTLQQLKKERDQDQRTGLLNHLGFHEACAPLPHARGLRVLVLSEIQGLDTLYATHGLVQTEHVLRQWSQLLRNQLRATDPVARLGNNMVAMALAHSSPAEAQALVQRIRDRMSTQRWGEGPDLGTITAHFGLVDVQPGESLDHAMRRADAALQLAKHSDSGILADLARSVPVRSTAQPSVPAAQPRPDTAPSADPGPVQHEMSATTATTATAATAATSATAPAAPSVDADDVHALLQAAYAHAQSAQAPGQATPAAPQRA